MSKKLFFGEYLVSQNLAPREKIEEALKIQASSIIPIGKLAVKMGFLNRKDSIKILLQQKENGKRFGDLALEGGLLTTEQISILIELKRMEAFFLGKILEQMGVLSRLKVLRELVKFHNGHKFADQ